MWAHSSLALVSVARGTVHYENLADKEDDTVWSACNGPCLPSASQREVPGADRLSNATLGPMEADDGFLHGGLAFGAFTTLPARIDDGRLDHQSQKSREKTIAGLDATSTRQRGEEIMDSPSKTARDRRMRPQWTFKRLRAFAFYFLLPAIIDSGIVR